MLSYLSSGRFHLQQNEQSIDKVISAIAAWSSIQTMQTAQNEHASLSGEQSPYSATASTPHEPPANPTPKNVAFELLLDENSKVRARIPMRVQIYPHDTTDSIVTTVKNFYGIYDGAASGVSFEDENGITLIARYENLRNNMTVYVRVIPIQAYTDIYGDHYHGSIPVEARKHPNIEDAYRMGGMQPAHLLEHGRSPSRPASRIARKRSPSPSCRSRRSASQNKQSKSGNKSRGSSTHGSFHDDGAGYSDSDATYTSKKARSDHFASSDISMDNILQDGRRKRPKFDSSVSLYNMIFLSAPFTTWLNPGLTVYFLPPPGATSIRSSPGSSDDCLHFAAASIRRSRRSRLAIRTPDAAPIQLSATISVSAEFWLQ